MSRSAKRYRVWDTGSGSLIMRKGEIVARAGMGPDRLPPRGEKRGWRISHGIALSGTGSILKEAFPFSSARVAPCCYSNDLASSGTLLPYGATIVSRSSSGLACRPPRNCKTLNYLPSLFLNGQGKGWRAYVIRDGTSCVRQGLI